ncbi:MAG: hypothetical protein Q8R57_14505 [Bacteroidota bacterium]|nr:hypothetical protein [Bacteroidota bacterium]
MTAIITLIMFRSKNTYILIFLFNCISFQSFAQKEDINLVDMGWSIENNSQIRGIYKMINNLNKKIIIKKIWIQRNTTHQVDPYVSGWQDSVILLPFEQKTYQYSSYMLNMYLNDFGFFSAASN